MVAFDSGAQGGGIVIESVGDDHEFLHVDVAGGVCPPVEDVHLRDRDARLAASGDMSPERLFGMRRCRVQAGERGTEHGVGAEIGLVRGPVKFEQDLIYLLLVSHLHADERVADLDVDVGNRTQNPFAAEE